MDAAGKSPSRRRLAVAGTPNRTRAAPRPPTAVTWQLGPDAIPGDDMDADGADFVKRRGPRRPRRTNAPARARGVVGVGNDGDRGGVADLHPAAPPARQMVSSRCVSSGTPTWACRDATTRRICRIRSRRPVHPSGAGEGPRPLGLRPRQRTLPTRSLAGSDRRYPRRPRQGRSRLCGAEGEHPC